MIERMRGSSRRGGLSIAASVLMILAASGLAAAAAVALRGGQDQAPVGYLPGDRVVAMAAAADASIASFTPSPEALASFVALVDPVHLRMFFRSAQAGGPRPGRQDRPDGRGAANPALSAEFVGVVGRPRRAEGPDRRQRRHQGSRDHRLLDGPGGRPDAPRTGGRDRRRSWPISSSRPGPRSPRKCSSTTSSSSTPTTRTFWSSTASAVTGRRRRGVNGPVDLRTSRFRRYPRRSSDGSLPAAAPPPRPYGP